MTRQHIHVRTASEPEHPQRQLDPLVFRVDRVGRVSVLMRPDTGTGQGPWTCERVEVLPLAEVSSPQDSLGQVSLPQVSLLDRLLQSLLIAKSDRQKGYAAVWAQ
jgi:hypothetical protein